MAPNNARRPRARYMSHHDRRQAKTGGSQVKMISGPEGRLRERIGRTARAQFWIQSRSLIIADHRYI